MQCAGRLVGYMTRDEDHSHSPYHVESPRKKNPAKLCEKRSTLKAWDVRDSFHRRHTLEAWDVRDSFQKRRTLEA